MRALFRKISVFIIMICLSVGTLFPLMQPVFAASVFNPEITYNQGTGQWDIQWTPIDGTETYSLVWHGPDGLPQSHTNNALHFNGTYDVVSLTILPDHIYDLTFSFKDSGGNPVYFQNKYGQMVSEETLFFLSDISFQGTSFNDVAVLGGLEDADPDKTESGGQTVRITSGNDPKVTLRWKVPTIWEPNSYDILPITHTEVDLDLLESGGLTHADLDYAYFHIGMNEVTDMITERIFSTTVQEETGSMIVKQSGKTVEGLNTDGEVTTADGYVYFTLDRSDDILPGTEYENVNIKLTFQSGSSEAPYTRLYTGSNRFMVENKDNIFQSTGQVTSIFTPLRFEASKVDIDKLELTIYKIKSRNYTELFYEVQNAGSIVELLENPDPSGSGIKLPDASIPDSTGWGSLIVEIPIDQNGEHPERFYRFVVTDGDSQTPLGSLAINLQDLGNDTGKPPVPREIQAQPIYNGKQEVVYENPPTPVTIKIPLSDVRLSFEKPLSWRTEPWGNIVSSPDDDNDFTFHVLLNTYLSDEIKLMETKEIGEEPVPVFVPVKEKRMVSFGKHQLQEDPNDSSRLIFEMHGSDLFYDYVKDNSLVDENDEDYDMNGNADYPTFLLPNTTYYLRMFSTRFKDHDNIEWALREERDFEEDISYISPTVSFTTYPSREIPVPLPNLTLDVDLDEEPDPETGKPVLNGITVDFPKILNDNDWQHYTNITDGRRIEYELYINDRMDEDRFILLGPPFIEPVLETRYPDENPDAGLSAIVTAYPAGDGEALKPNTTYYFKAQAKLYVNGEEDPFLIGGMTPIKSITTPKTDSGNLDDLDREPRTPVEFSIARDGEGELELTDAKVSLNWLHAEPDVTYEMVVTKNKLGPNASEEDYANDVYNIGDRSHPGFLEAYREYMTNSDDTELHIDVINTELDEAGFTYNADNTRVAYFPVKLPFLRPNHLYYFSLRAVRDRGTDDALYSSWVSIPVTTKMVSPPDFFEAVSDVQLGFNVRIYGDIPPEDVRMMLKKGYQSESAYVDLSRAKYSVVRDGRRYYIRLYDLDPDTWYDIQPYYTRGDTKYWYDHDDQDWRASDRSPLKMRTRDTLNEIEVRFAGESRYDYFLEVRTDDDADYVELEYDDDDETDYGYTLTDGSRIEFYREKTHAYVEEGLDKYVYYAKISHARRIRSDGTYKRLPLLSNTRYYIKVWARNVEDSKHLGPVTIRTDFNQDDYDKDHMKDQIRDLFETKADRITRKLYFTVNEMNRDENRVMLKAARVSNLMRMSGHSGVTIDISKEMPDAMQDVILIPYDILDTLQKSNSRLTMKLAGCEMTLTRDSLDLDALKKLAQAIGNRETMLEITVVRKASGAIPAPLGFTYGSKVYDIGMKAVGMRRTYAEMNMILYDILKEPEAKGPFQYGILDRELVKLLEREKTLTYQSHVELENLVSTIIDQVEEELSMYIRDILDGGRGFSASEISRRDVPELYGGMKLKFVHTGSTGTVKPYMLLSGRNTWEEPQGIKAWVFPYVLMTAKAPGQYVVFCVPTVNIPAPEGVTNPDFERLANKYDLQRVFGSRTLYSGDYVSGESAVGLFEVITETRNEVEGLSVPAKIRYYHLEEILTLSAFQPNISREQAAGLVVEIYAYKTGVTSDRMRPSTMPYIKNSDMIPDPVYHRLVIALDLGITELEPDDTFAGDRPATVEEVLNEVVTVLELLGEW